jgi:NAD(P)H-flavin reductase
VLLTLPVREVVTATPRSQIVRLDLGSREFAYDAGQAVMVAPHGDAKRRPFSLSSAPADARRDGALELLVGTDPSDTSGEAFVPVVDGLVDIEGPLGSFTLPRQPAERRFLFFAGGTGVAPLRAMLRHALTMPHESIGFFYSARTPDEFAYADEMRALAAAGRIELQLTITRTTPADWTGGRGRVTRAALKELVHDPATLCFVCGPPALVEEVPRLLEEIGIQRTRIKTEEQ